MHYTTKQELLENDDIYIPEAIENIEQNGFISFKTILTEAGIEGAIPCLYVLGYRTTCLFQADVAELIVHLTDGDAARLAVQAIRDWHAGKITDKQLEKASFHAYKAYYASSTDSYTACSVYYASYAASSASYATSSASYAFVFSNTNTPEQDYWDKIEKLFIEHFCRE